MKVEFNYTVKVTREDLAKLLNEKLAGELLDGKEVDPSGLYADCARWGRNGVGFEIRFSTRDATVRRRKPRTKKAARKKAARKKKAARR